MAIWTKEYHKQNHNWPNHIQTFIVSVNRLKQIEEGAVIESEVRLTFVQLNREAKLPTIFG